MGRRRNLEVHLTSDTPPAVAQSILKRRANKHKKNATSAEKAMQRILEKMGVRYIFQSIHLAGGHYRIFDFYLPGNRTFIEVDGMYHDAALDALKDGYIIKKKHRFTILRFTNGEVLTMPNVVAGVIRLTTNP